MISCLSGLQCHHHPWSPPLSPPLPLVPSLSPPVPPLSPANQCKLYQIDCSRLQPMPFQNAAAPPICPEENVLVNCCRTRVPQKLPQKIAHVLRLARGSSLRICSQGFSFFFWEVSFCHSLLLGFLLTMSFLLPFYTLRLRLPPFFIIVSLLRNENYDSKDHLINDYSHVQGGGGGQFSSIHRRAAQAGTTLTQVIFVIALIFNITIIPIVVINVIVVPIFDRLDPQMRNNFFENEDDSPLLVTSIDGISTQVSSSSSS